MCDAPDCKQVGYAKIMCGNEVLVRLCVNHAYEFCISVYDFQGAKHVKEMAKREIADRELNGMP
jgi:hypothetical protein